MNVTDTRRTPAGVRLKVRRPGFSLPTRRYWNDGDPVKTCFLDAFSVLLPAYEHFFIATVNRARARIDEPVLREEARLFCAQEGQHASAHRKYNQHLVERGGHRTVERVERGLRRALARLEARLPEAWLLAMAAGGEHVTTYVAHEYLSHPERWSSGADPEIEALFRWHAAEEIEHKAVCFDVYARLDGTSWLRRLALPLVSIPSVLLVLGLQLHLLAEDGLLRDRGVVRRLVRLHLGRDGVIVGLLREHARYFAEAFHPWDVDDAHLARAATATA